MADGWWRAEVAARYLGVSIEFLRQRAHNGEIVGYKVMGSGRGARTCWRFKREHLDAFIEKGARGAA